MREIIENIRTRAIAEIEAALSSDDLDRIRLTYLVRKGRIAELFDKLRAVPPAEKPLIGKLLNELRNAVQSAFDARQTAIEAQGSGKKEFIDLTIPGRLRPVGTKHPVTQTLDEMKRIFMNLGFSVANGPEAEDDYHNFGALNFPPDHPARDMQDTFFIGDQVLLRTHTSPVQIRVMENQKPPIRVIMPGRCYRNEAINTRSYCIFHQIEGLYVDKHVTFGELKGTLFAFARQFYGQDIKYRFRPSFFPFTEPSAEMDITCYLCHGKGCRVCKYTGWLEILGCGMVDPNVFKAVGYDPEEVTGYAFGMGIERVALLRYGINDIRILFENDIRFLNQF
jgi:phenylalanyl-tRNA synthetase alpha chain